MMNTDEKQSLLDRIQALEGERDELEALFSEVERSLTDPNEPDDYAPTLLQRAQDTMRSYRHNGEIASRQAARILTAEAQAEAAEARALALEVALETFAILANADTAYLPDEHVISLTYDDSELDDELGGPNTLLGERYMRAFRAARALLPQQKEAEA